MEDSAKRISLVKLWEDHKALADAVHGLLGRNAILEARVDYLERSRDAAKKLVERTGQLKEQQDIQPRRLG